MQAAQIDDVFAITERCKFWVAQPAFRAEGRNSHWITRSTWPECDYRIVNFVELGVAIFRQDKLMEFLTVYDGSLVGYGIDYWYMNLFKANEFRRFAIIDKVQVINPHDEDKGGREIDRLQPESLRRATWLAVKDKVGLVEFPHEVFYYCRILQDHRKPGNTLHRAHRLRLVMQHGVCWLAAHYCHKRNTVASYIRALRDTVHKQIMINLGSKFSTLRSRGWNKTRGPLHAPSISAAGQKQTLAERLGYGPQQRLLIVHADDLGIAHSVNAAFIRGFGTGLINSGSVMVPCPWFPEVVAFARRCPGADIGLHLTLTSERTAYRWGPVAPRTQVPSLVDEVGYFRQTWTAETRVSPREVELELRAQIESIRCRASPHTF